MKITIPWLKNNNTVSGRVGVAMGPDGLSVAHINAAGVVDFCQNYPQPGDSADLLSSLVAEQGWHACPCSLVLHPLYYQLTLAESPAVEAAEIAYNLFKNAKLTARCRRLAFDEIDLSAVVFVVFLNMFDLASGIEVNDHNLLLDYRLVEECPFFGPPTDIVPNLFIEGTHCRRRAEKRAHIFL